MTVKVPRYDHYHVTQQLGYKPILYCWCGAVCDLNVQKHPRTSIQAFKREHDECEKPAKEALQAVGEVI